MGYNPKNSNIPKRLQEWAEKNHIDAFLNYLLGRTHPFFSITHFVEAQTDGIIELPFMGSAGLRRYVPYTRPVNKVLEKKDGGMLNLNFLENCEHDQKESCPPMISSTMTLF
jgi:hypothetical protein